MSGSIMYCQNTSSAHSYSRWSYLPIFVFSLSIYMVLFLCVLYSNITRSSFSVEHKVDFPVIPNVDCLCPCSRFLHTYSKYTWKLW